MTEANSLRVIKSRQYGALDFDSNERAWIITDLEPHVSIRLKQLFPGLPKSSRGPFKIPGTSIASADIEWFESRYNMVMSSECREQLSSLSKSFFDDQAEATRILMPDFVPTERPGLKPGQKFRRYQSQGLELTELVRSLVLVDDIGLGKSYEGLGVGLIPGTLPMVIVVEPHLQTQWAEKAEEFVNLRVHCPKGNTPYNLPDADIYIFKYNQLSPWVDIIASGWVKAVVFDEIQQLRSGLDSAKGTAANELCRAVDVHGGVLCGLTATPIFNYGIEAFNIVNIIRPGFLGTKDEFMREWCDKSVDGGKGVVKDPEARVHIYKKAMFFYVEPRRMWVRKRSNLLQRFAGYRLMRRRLKPVLSSQNNWLFKLYRVRFMKVGTQHSN